MSNTADIFLPELRFPYVLFERATGKIVSFGRAATATDAALQADPWPLLDVLQVDVPEADRPTVYVAGRSVVQRPTLPIDVPRTTLVADGLDTITLSGFPAKTRLTVNGFYTTADYTLDLRAREATTYHLECEAFPYLPWSLDVTAVAE